MLKMARRNLLEIWPDSTFHQPYFEHALFRRSIFVCNSPETVRQVFVEDAANVMRKSSQQVHALKPLIGDGLFISDGELWQQRRKAIAPLTHISRLGEFVPAMAAAAAERAAMWHAAAGAEIDVLADMAELTADVICRAVFGTKLGHDHATEVVRGFSAFQAAVGQTDLISLLGLPEFLPRLNGRRVRESTRRVHAVVDSVLHDVLAAGDAGEASLVRGLAATLGGEALRDETSVLLMAGHETTANTLAWAWYLLSQDAAAWERLVAEVDAPAAPPAHWTTCNACRSPARSSTRRCVCIHRCRYRLDDRRRRGRSRIARCRPIRSSCWCRGCCTGTRVTGISRMRSCPPASCREAAACRTVTPMSPSVSARASAPAPRSH